MFIWDYITVSLPLLFFCLSPSVYWIENVSKEKYSCRKTGFSEYFYYYCIYLFIKYHKTIIKLFLITGFMPEQHSNIEDGGGG